MGLVNKLKNILFEEEEIEVPVIEKKEKIVSEPVMREIPRKEEVKQVPDYSNFYKDEQVVKPTNNINRVVEQPRMERVPEKIETNVDTVSEREIFKSEKTFNFPAFDEEEFESSMPRRTTNVMEHERKRFKKENPKKVQEVKKEEPMKNKFRPSPIISPVYGILDKNYVPEEIMTRESSLRPLDVDSVRRKAFGTLEDDIMEDTKVNTEIDDHILEEKLEKARTIDELLKDSSDDEIVVNDNIVGEKYNDFSRLEDTITDLRKEFGNKLNDELDRTIESLDEEVKPQVQAEVKEEDTLESDLFDLIDSMYENREDGE